MEQNKNLFSDFKNVYFIGIGGIGMSALARYFNNLGFRQKQFLFLKIIAFR